MEASGNLEEMTKKTKETADHAIQAKDLSSQASQSANLGSDLMDNKLLERNGQSTQGDR